MIRSIGLGVVLVSMSACSSLIPSPGKLLGDGFVQVIQNSAVPEEEKALETASGQEPIRKTILSCIESNDLAGLKELVGDVDDIKTLVPPDTELLEIAIVSLGHKDTKSDVLPFLVEHKAWIYQRDKEGKTVLDKLYENEMAESRQAEQVRELLLPVISRWEEALENDRPAEVIALLDRVDAQAWLVFDALTWKAPKVLDFAVNNGYAVDTTSLSLSGLFASNKKQLGEDDLNRMVRAAIDAGISPDASSGSESSPINMILNNGKGFESTAILLLKSGAHAEPDSIFTSAFSRSWMGLADYAISKGYVPQKHLVSWARVDSIPWFLANGWAPGDFAGPVRAMNAEDQKKAIQVLLENGLPLSTIDFSWVGDNIVNFSLLRSLGVKVEGSTAVIILVRNKRSISEVEEYLRLKADPDARDWQKMTSLHYAVMNDDLPLVKLLLSYGADINAVNKFNRTPLGYCRKNSNEMRVFLEGAGGR